MTHVYQQSAYVSAPYSFEAAINTETNQLRAIAPVESFYVFNAGTAAANENYLWEMKSDVVVNSFWVRYPGAPGGTINIFLLDPLGNVVTDLSLNTNSNGEKFDNAWVYKFNGTFGIPKGFRVRFNSSVPISNVSAYATPAIFFDVFNGIRI